MATIDRQEILHWLRCDDEQALEELWQRADAIREQTVGDEVHLRGLIEIGNYCERLCGYCGLRAGNSGIQRYRMPAEAIIACAYEAYEYGYGTVVMQAGEDPGIKADFIAGILRRIKAETPLAVTLSLGERSPEDLTLWREAGADRYLLRFETSNAELYATIHPGRGGQPSSPEDRFSRLRKLRELGYEVGSGVMLGIPGQSYDSLADDLLTFLKLDLDMIGVGPYIAHPDTPMGQGEWCREVDPAEQVPGTELMCYKAVALTRIVCPEANIPSTSALATLNIETGRELGLLRGANVVMPNMTPVEYREHYEIYPAKACIKESAEKCHGCMRMRIHSIGRTTGSGQGGRRRAE